ncbi:MAG: hypothetical protein U0R26_08525 [Solirubrobacterales bacterium]
MGRGRARAAVAGVIGALAVAVAVGAAGCGSESHRSDPRPQVSIRVSVTIGPKAVIVQPGAIGTGPARTQQIPQNQNHPQPPIRTDGPLNVVLVAANQTRFDSHLELHGPKDLSSGPVLANSPGSFQADLPTGTYTITAADIPAARAGKLVVGPYRASSQNDVLLP